jgi:hypothetical protein
VYGLVHDQITIRVCPEYFTVFHPRIMDTENLTFIALGWGVVATWWMGAGIGFVLGLAARWGAWPTRTWVELVRPVTFLLCVMAVCALVCGILGYRFGTIPAGLADQLSTAIYRRFAADWWAHMASYASGFFGGLGLCVFTMIQRYRAA